MAMAYCSAGRVSALVRGDRFQSYIDENGKRKVRKIGKYPGLLRRNVSVEEGFIRVSGMRVVKRSRKVIERYGESVTVRNDFVIPLKRGLFENPYWDQLVPFAYLVLDYLEKYAPEQGCLFPFGRVRAWQIINAATGMWSHWFRAQAEHFYGFFLLTDSVKLSEFVKVTDPKSVKPYIGYDWREQLKDKQLGMDFKWIDRFLAERKNL